MDHYQTLGVAKNATPDEIKKAYRKLASQHHPDKGGDTAMFQKVEEAYRILSDPAKRQQYDNPNPFGNQAGNPFNGTGFNFSFGPEGFNFNDIFEMFGDRRGPNQEFQRRQQIFRTNINVTLEQAYFGGEQHIQLQTPTGSKMVKIEIPRGIDTGFQSKINNVIDGATLLVEFRVHRHLKFDRNGNDLISNQPISVLDLIVGTTFEFTTLGNKTLEVTVKPHTQPHMHLKITGAGMPIIGTEHKAGDQIILLKPFIPDIIDEQIINAIQRTKGLQ